MSAEARMPGELITPEHIKKIGPASWVLLHMLHTMDFETGRIDGWRDTDEAEKIGLPSRTVRQHRQRLEHYGYIRCRQGLHCQVITVNDIARPREKRASIREATSVFITALQSHLPIHINGKSAYIAKNIPSHEQTPKHAEVFAEWWYANDWRGKKGEAPTANQIIENWPAAMKEMSKRARKKADVIFR